MLRMVTVECELHDGRFANILKQANPIFTQFIYTFRKRTQPYKRDQRDQIANNAPALEELNILRNRLIYIKDTPPSTQQKFAIIIEQQVDI